MAEIIIRDYEDDFWGDVNCIGMGLNHSNVIVPLIESAIESKEDITVNINSGGGSVFCGLAITNALQRAKESGLKVTTVNEALCASAATMIYMQGDERISYASLFMIHKPSLFIFGSMTAEDMKKEQAALDIVQETILSTYAPTGLDESVLNDMINAETWLTPAMCLTLGFSTEDRSTSQETKTDVLEANFAAIKEPVNRIYANKYFNSIKSNKMDGQELLKQTTNQVKETNTILNWFKNHVPAIFKNEDEVEITNAESDLASGDKIYYAGVLGVGTEVFTDEAMTEHPEAGDHDLADGDFITVDELGIVTVLEKKEVATEDNSEEVSNLKNEIESLKAQLSDVSNSLTESNKVLQNLKDTKSKFTPPTRQQEIDRKKVEDKETSKFVKPSKKK